MDLCKNTPMRWARVVWVWCAGLALLGCSASSSGTGSGGAAGAGAFGGGSGGTANSGGSANSGGTHSGGTGGVNVGGTGAGGAGGTSGGGQTLVYAHTDTTLYQMDPTQTKPTLMKLGDFDCIGGTGQDVSMTDIAVDKDGNLWGIDHTAVMPLTVQGSVAHCGTPIQLVNPKSVSYYALTFAPVGVLDAAKEVLVAGNTAGELWAIDATGNLSLHGNFGTVPANDGNGHSYKNSGKAWELSGDIVFLANNGNPVGFATVRDCPNPPSSTSCDTVDTLIEIDVPKLANAGSSSVTKAIRGQIVKSAGCSDTANTGYGSMYGIAAWNDKVFGFSRKEHLVEISANDGSACLVDTYAGVAFAGAGVTTVAPIVIPTPK